MRGTSLNLTLRSITIALCFLPLTSSVNAYGQGASGEAPKKPSKTTAPRTASAKPSRPSKKNATAGKTGGANSSQSVDNSKAVEMAFWDSVKNSTNPDDFRAYLRKYPNGEFIDIARNRINSLESAQMVAPTLISPADGAVFDFYPRTTTLKWSAVPNAVSYVVEIDWYEPGGTYEGKTFKAGWAHELRPNEKKWIIKDIKSTNTTFDFIGAQPGRWRVWAVLSGGRESPKSDWFGFVYEK